MVGVGARAASRRSRVRSATALAGVVALALVVGPLDAAGAKPYLPAGPRLSGGDNAGAAVPLQPGQYLDTLARGSTGTGSDGSTRYYAITLRAGQTPYFAATMAGPDSASGERVQLSVTFTARGSSSSCASASNSDSNYDDGSVALSAVTVVAAPGAAGSERACPVGTVVVALARSGDAGTNDPLDVEIAYRLEPAAAASGLPPAATKQDYVDPDLIGTPAALESGHSFAKAPVLGSGIYRDSLEPTDVHIVRIHLDWGQRFSYAVTASPRPDLDSGALPRVMGVIRNPLRQEIGQAARSNPTAYSFGSADSGLEGAVAAPVRFANRFSDDSSVAGCAAAGDYFLVLTSERPDAADGSGTFPYTLQIRVFGTASGAPDYRVDAESSPAPARSKSMDTDPISSTTVLVASVVGVGALLIAGLGLLVLRRRRQASGAGVPRPPPAH